MLRLRRDQVDLKEGLIRLSGQDPKSGKPRVVALQRRTVEALKAVPVFLHSPYFFVNPETKKPRTEYRDAWIAAQKAAGVQGVWIHDLRRSFCTITRKRGQAESEVMESSGHTTTAVFRRYNIVDEDDARKVARVMEQGRNLGQEMVNAGSEADQAPEAGCVNPATSAGKLNAPGPNRTGSLWVRSPTLYPVELRAHHNVRRPAPGQAARGWVEGVEPTTPGATVPCSAS